MPVTHLAPRCHCGRPLIDGLVCRRHELLARVSGGFEDEVPNRVETWPIIEHEPEHIPEIPPDLPVTLPRAEFEAEVRAWLGREG